MPTIHEYMRTWRHTSTHICAREHSGEFHLDLIPFERDLLSLELNHSFKECFLQGDPSSLHSVACSVMRLQSMFGVIASVRGKGDNSLRVHKLVLRMTREMNKVRPLPLLARLCASIRTRGQICTGRYVPADV